MTRSPVPLLNLVFHPASPDRWADIETLFGPRGAYGGCWCIWWRLSRAQFEREKGDGNREALRDIVLGGAEPGVLAYDGEEPVGWCAVAPREVYPALERSRTLRRIDDTPVWSITCLFVARPHRGKGLSPALLRAAADHAAGHGATVVEGYPVASREGRLHPASAFMGLPSAFRAAGFVEAARLGERRLLMRREAAQRG